MFSEIKILLTDYIIGNPVKYCGHGAEDLIIIHLIVTLIQRKAQLMRK
jgi:hypothetical protein